MSAELFAALDSRLETQSPAEVLDFLIAEMRERRNYGVLFEAQLMKRRLELGLPLIQTGEVPADKQQAYEEGMIEAAREAGTLFLESGKLDRAFPYFRAIGELGPVREALEKLDPGEEQADAAIEIAYQQGVHPVKGLEWILNRHGVCRAITSFGMFGVPNGRQECMKLLVGYIHRELGENLKTVIAQREGTRPETDNISLLIADREWLFGEYDTYIDTSHLSSVIQYAPDVTDRETLGKIRELCDYGKRLNMNFRIRGNPPFEDIFVDHAAYAGALLGMDVEDGIGHFAAKLDPEEPLYAQALVNLLLRLDRVREAMEVSVEYLRGYPDVSCPSTLQLCHMARDYEQLRELARGSGDVLSYAAASITERG